MLAESAEPSEEADTLEEVFSSRGRIKILRLLVEKGELNITSIVTLAGVCHKYARAHLREFMKVGLVQEKRYGRIRIYRFCIETQKARAIKKLIEIWDDCDLK
jgi:predicted transcriptional regulator